MMDGGCFLKSNKSTAKGMFNDNIKWKGDIELHNLLIKNRKWLTIHYLKALWRKDLIEMPDESFKYILNREEAFNHINEHFRKTIVLIQSVVDYGTNLIPRCFRQSNRQIEDIVVLAVLLRHIVSMLDGVSVLVSQGCIYPAHLQVRSLFEAFISMEWILKGNTSKRALQYYVWNLRSRRMWALKFNSASTEHSDFIRKVDKYKDSLLTRSQEYEAEVKLQSDSITNLLSKEPYHEVNQEFDRLRGSRRFDVPWYRPNGPNSVSDMAERLGYGAEYEVFYSQYSQIMHASAQLNNVKLGKKGVVFEPIRKLDRLRPLLNVGLGFAIKAYRTVLNRYRPEELQNFTRKYITDWQKEFLSITSVTYKEELHSLDL